MTAQTLPTTEAATPKIQYRVTNWPQYARALVERGRLTLWFDEAFLQSHWRPAPTGKRGAPFRYSDEAIQALLGLKAVFNLPYRRVAGLAGSIVRLLGLALPIPDHRLMSRRAKTRPVNLPRRARTEPLHVGNGRGQERPARSPFQSRVCSTPAAVVPRLGRDESPNQMSLAPYDSEWKFKLVFLAPAHQNGPIPPGAPLKMHSRDLFIAVSRNSGRGRQLTNSWSRRPRKGGLSIVSLADPCGAFSFDGKPLVPGAVRLVVLTISR